MSLEDRVVKLETFIAGEQASLRRGTRYILVTYLVLLVVVAGYVTYVTAALKDLTSMKGQAQLLQAAVSELGTLRGQLLRDYQANKQVWAKESADYLVAQIDGLEPLAQEGMKSLFDMLGQEIEQRTIPAFTEALKANAAELKAANKDLTDKEVAQGLAILFNETIDKELAAVINENLVKSINSLQKDLDKLARADVKTLTAKQDAERRLIQDWVWLTEHTPVGESVFEGLFKLVEQEFKISLRDLGIPTKVDEANPEIIDDKIAAPHDPKEF